jgi:hypothetical protein
MKLRYLVRALLVLAAVFTACVPSTSKTAALKGIEEFHNRFNRNEFAEIYEESDQKAKDKITKNDFLEDMKAMREGQGAVLDSQEIATEYNYMNGVSMVKILVQVSYEKGNAKEEFIYYIKGESAQLASYRFLGQ